jgi:exopolyphosphatase/guanosine-5'-triphosphate,3'-diphosphate pyrophosphatase
MLGFTRNEQQIVATLIRAHRYKFPAAVLNEMGDMLTEPVMRLCIMLRIAVLLQRGHKSEELPDIEMRASGNAVQLQFPKGWLKKHALTRADLKQEKKYLEAVNVLLAFER